MPSNNLQLQYILNSSIDFKFFVLHSHKVRLHIIKRNSMKKITCLLTLTMLLCNALSTLAMQSQKQPKTNLVIIPGQDEFEGQNIDTVLPYFADKIKLKHYVEPLSLPDLGQERCIRRLATTMSSFKK